MNIPAYLRTFHGHGARSCSYARFPYEELNLVLESVKNTPGFFITEYFGRCELDGRICISYKDMWCCIRRKNGEDHWNICLVRSHVFQDFDESTMLKLFNVLRKAGVNLKTPTEPYEYIPPMSEITINKYYQNDVRGWCRTDPINIREAQEIEEQWQNERQVAAN